MGERFRHARHVLRVAAVFGVALVAFLIARWALIPPDFGVHGYYRAGALDDNRALPVVHAGRAACVECHDGAYDPPEPEEGAAPRPAVQAALNPARDNRHFRLNCETCHGPLQRHVDDTEIPIPKVGSDGLCLGCHLALDGRPASQPQVVPAGHMIAETRKAGCISCHKPHWPKAGDG